MPTHKVTQHTAGGKDEGEHDHYVALDWSVESSVDLATGRSPSRRES
jgi:hypothetical protein